MKLVKLKDVIETLEKLKGSYENLRLLITDQVRDNQITEARDNFEKLQKLDESIKQMEDLDVQV